MSAISPPASTGGLMRRDGVLARLTDGGGAEDFAAQAAAILGLPTEW